MGYIEQNLISGEEIAYRSGLHWIVLVRSIVVAVVLAVLGIVMLVEASQVDGTQSRQIVNAVGVIAILIGAIDLLAAMIRRSGAEFAVTNKRVILQDGRDAAKQRGDFSKQVESVTVEEAFPGPGARLRNDQRPRHGRHARALTTTSPMRKSFVKHVQEQISKNP